jgi:crotonobetainyl-CoA:carnitine CoA-transferase CaiB-like acyl-CoA transferase
MTLSADPAIVSEMRASVPGDKLPVLQPGRGFEFLSDVRVLDLTTSVAGPYASMLLSDFGAEVIKIERPDGDDARSWGPPFLADESLWFLAVNRNKKSVVVDMNDPVGHEHLRSLVREVDVVVTNQPASVQKKLGLDYETLCKLNPEIIFTSITGFGLNGARADLTCYDLIAEGYSGIMDVTGEAGGDPQKIGAPAADMLAGQDAAMATIAALYDRKTSGVGRRIDVSLVESMTRFLSCRISAYLGSGEVPKRSGGTDSVIAIYQQFQTADTPLTLGLGTDGIWKRFWQAVGNPAYAYTTGFESNASRRRNREQIVRDIQTVLLAKQRDEWLSIFAAARVPAGPIYSVDEVVSDAALLDRGLFFLLEDGGRLVPQVGLGIHIDGVIARPRSAPPRLGQHTDDYLR